MPFKLLLRSKHTHFFVCFTHPILLFFVCINFRGGKLLVIFGNCMAIFNVPQTQNTLLLSYNLENSKSQVKVQAESFYLHSNNFNSIHVKREGVARCECTLHKHSPTHAPAPALALVKFPTHSASLCCLLCCIRVCMRFVWFFLYASHVYN